MNRSFCIRQKLLLLILQELLILQKRQKAASVDLCLFHTFIFITQTYTHLRINSVYEALHGPHDTLRP